MIELVFSHSVDGFCVFCECLCASDLSLGVAEW